MARYTELLVRGDDRELKAYLAGCAAATASLRVELADESGFHLRQLRERIRHHGEVHHVIIESSHTAATRGFLERAADRYRWEIVDQRSFDRAHFAFEFDTPSHEVARKLKVLLGGLPATVRLENYAPKEETDPEAQEAELYTPEHHYRFEGSGTARGDVFAVIDLRKDLSAIDFVRCTEIVVDRIS